MQIIPTIFVLLCVISYVMYAFFASFQTNGVETRHLTARYEAERELVKIVVKNKYDTLRKRSPTETTRKTPPAQPRKISKILQPHSLSPLLTHTPPPQLLSLYEQLFVFYYTPMTFRGKPIGDAALKKLFHTLLGRAIECARDGGKITWESLLEQDSLREKLLEGTHRLSFTPHKGYPSIDKVFTFTERARPIAYSGLPEQALPLLFSPSEAALILEEEAEQRNGAPLSIRQLEALLPTHPMLQYLASLPNKREKIAACDKNQVIEVREGR